MHLIGLDIGTTGCKASLFAADGVWLGSASREYRVELPRPGWAEQNLLQVWALAKEALAELLVKTGIRQVLALGLSVHGEAVTPVDERGIPLRPTILGMDTRTSTQNERIRERFGAAGIFEQTGMPIHTVNTLPKLLWIREHEPEIWQAAHRFMLVEDFLLYHMTGEAVISRCLASRTQMYDLRRGGWSAEILAYLGIGEEKLSRLAHSGTAVGKMHAALSAEIGFEMPPLVVAGGHDQACGALGVGVTRGGLAEVSTGTAEVVEVALEQPVLSAPILEGNVSVYEHTAAGLYLAMTLNHSGGILLRWFRDTLCEGEMQRAAASGTDAYDLMLRAAPDAPTNLFVLPHFAGSGTPWFDTRSRGAILGLTFATTRAEIARAILEGLTFDLKVNLDILRAGGVPIDTLRAIGGGAKSPLWLQMKADITGIPVAAPIVTEAASFGAALLAGAGAGAFPSAAEAASQFLQFRHIYHPRAEVQLRYAERYELYREVYPLLKEFHWRM